MMLLLRITALCKITKIEYLTLNLNSDTLNGKILSNITFVRDLWISLTVLEVFMTLSDNL